MYLICPECGEKKIEDKDFDESNPEKTKCPKCGESIVLPEACCGFCVHSSELSDGYLLCCINSTVEKLNIVPFNSECSGCQNYESYSGFMDDNFEENLDNMINQIEAETDEDSSEEQDKNEFDDAFDNV